jgi:hypothetical protein
MVEKTSKKQRRMEASCEGNGGLVREARAQNGL